MRLQVWKWFFVIPAFLQLAACASSVPKVEFTQAPAPEVRLDANDAADITVDAADGVSLVNYEKERLAHLIGEKLAALQSMNTEVGAEGRYNVKVTVTRYDKGNAFARAMFAGLGQIHVDANVQLFMLDADAETKVADFNIDKTFAWGGIYGASTRIEDVEPAFAEGIARALTGRETANGESKEASARE